MRDARAREIDRPPFKVMGNRTLLEIADQKPTRASQLKGIKGITELLVRRMGDELLAAIEKGRDVDHPPIPKSTGNGRRRIDRKTERRVNELKKWRTQRSQELTLDPGVLCPNASLEAIAWRNPETGNDLEGLPELKGWFIREFGDEVSSVLHEEPEQAADAQAKPAAKAPAKAAATATATVKKSAK